MCNITMTPKGLEKYFIYRNKEVQSQTDSAQKERKGNEKREEEDNAAADDDDDDNDDDSGNVDGDGGVSLGNKDDNKTNTCRLI